MLDIISIRNLDQWPPSVDNIEFGFSDEAKKLLADRNYGKASRVGKVVARVCMGATESYSKTVDIALDLSKSEPLLQDRITERGFFDTVIEEADAITEEQKVAA